MKFKFPSDFSWGTAISAFQTEMGSSPGSVCTNTDWYEWANSAEVIREGLVSGDRPQDGDGFWDLYREDMKLARSLGNNAIRMSVEWARIFPDDTGGIEADFERNENKEPLRFSPTASTMSRLGSISDRESLEHYREMIEYAHSLGMRVFMTLYHWPLPLWLHSPVECHKDIEASTKKGWLDIKTVEEFAKYSFFISQTIGKSVDVWETINEPETVAISGYVLGRTTGFPPALEDIPMGFKVERNMAMGHNLAYRILKKNTGREVGIGTAPPYFEPASRDEKAREMTETARYLYNEWILNAAVNGEFDNSLSGKPDEKIENFGGSDYIGINYYTRMKVSYSEDAMYAGSLPLRIEPCENCSDIQMDIYPEGFRTVLGWIHEKYQRPMYILENGVADSSDSKRKNYIIDHLRVLLTTMNEDHIPVKGYFHWSLIDNFEWEKGYSMRLGLYEVDYDTKKRKKRSSADTYERICKGVYF